LDHVIVFSLLNDKTVHMDRYQVSISTAKKPTSSLTQIGPSMDLKINRTKFATHDLKKEAMRVPQELRKGKNRNKNISFDSLGTKEGRVHVQQENLDKIALRRYDTKGLIEQQTTDPIKKRNLDEISSFDETETSLRKKRNKSK
jgi:ribosome production factor 2